MQAVKVDEDLLSDVLSLMRIGQHPVGDAGDPRVFTFEQRFERLLAGLHD